MPDVLFVPALEHGIARATAHIARNSYSAAPFNVLQALDRAELRFLPGAPIIDAFFQE